MRLRKAPKAPLAVAGILATPLFFVALMAMSLAVEKPSVHHVLTNGKIVAKLGDPLGSTERAIWLLALVPPVGLVLIGVAGMFIGRAGVITSSLTAIAAALVLLLPLDTWTTRHTARHPDDRARRARTRIPRALRGPKAPPCPRTRSTPASRGHNAVTRASL